jgi:hypothetical protein
MNELYHAFDGDWEELTSILKEHPWMGSHHFEVPGLLINLKIVVDKQEKGCRIRPPHIAMVM